MGVSGETTSADPRREEREQRLRSPLFSCTLTLRLTVILLIVVTLLASLELSGVIERISTHDRIVTWSACGMLVSLAIAVLLLGRHMTQKTLEHIELQLRALAEDDRCLKQFGAPVPDDLKPVMAALNDYVAQVRARVERLHREQAELDTQMRVVDAEKRHTEAIICSISDAVLAIDPAGRLTMANTAAERLFDFRLSQSRSHPVEEVVHDRSLAVLLTNTRPADERQPRREIEQNLSIHGKARVFNVTLSTVPDACGAPHGQVAVFHDITRARELAQLKSDFVSAVSHELRTPLSSIRAYVEMLVDDEAHDEAERREFCRIIESETDRLQRLISNILSISRIESGVLPIQRQSVRINDVVREAIEMLSPQAAEKAIALSFEPTGNTPILRADRDLLHQAIINVVGNAIKYTQPNGHVQVATRLDQAASQMVVTVADDGMGIGKDDLPRIFDKFYRTRESTGVAQGTGLGLNLVRNIVETVHRGDVAVISEQGRGTTMLLRFPVQGGGGA